MELFLFPLFHGESQSLPSLRAVSKRALHSEVTSQFLVFLLGVSVNFSSLFSLTFPLKFLVHLFLRVHPFIEDIVAIIFYFLMPPNLFGVLFKEFIVAKREVEQTSQM